MTFLVTGATGFVGLHLVRALVAAGHHCRLLVRRESNVAALATAPGIELRYGDLRDADSLTGIADGITYVEHLAGAGHVSAISEEAHRRFVEVNVDGVANLMSACAGHGIERFVHFSSTAAMGLIRKPLVDESDEPKPVTPYQRSKWEGERTALRLGAELGVPTVVLRPCMIYGVGGEGEFARICRLMRRGLFPRVGLGRNLTPLVHVDDVVQAAILAAERGRSGETYLVASARSLGLDEMRRMVMHAWGARAPYPYVPVWLMMLLARGFESWARLTGGRPAVTRQNIASTVFDREFSIRKASEDLGFVPRVAFEEGIRRTVEWLKTRE